VTPQAQRTFSIANVSRRVAAGSALVLVLVLVLGVSMRGTESTVPQRGHGPSFPAIESGTLRLAPHPQETSIMATPAG